MKVYSDTLTYGDLAGATPAGVTLEECESINRARVRSRGWNVQLRRWGSNRHVNTGHYGAGEQGAASWDDHGEWMAVMFDLDPSARIAYYDGRDDFHNSTGRKYARADAA